MKPPTRRFRINRSNHGTIHTETSPSETNPSDTAPKSCGSCRRFKKRCSRSFPACSRCVTLGLVCSLSNPESSAAAEAHLLRARLAWLSEYFNNKLIRPPAMIEQVETGTDLEDVLILRSGAMVVPPSLPFNMDTSYNHVPTAIETHSLNGSVEPQSLNGPSMCPGLPPDAAARRFVDAYFRHVNRAYPFMSRPEVLSQLEIFGYHAERQKTAESTRLYLIMAIGCTTLQRAGLVHTDTTTRFEVVYADIMQECVKSGGIMSVQILVLLALYCLFDPNHDSASIIVQALSSQALLHGLTRRVPQDSSMSSTEIELRHRLYWSIYVLDRMMATSLGLPASLRDENSDVPLPGLTVDEFSSAERSEISAMLLTCRHVIQLRQLEDQILERVHLLKHSEIAATPLSDRRAILQALRAQIEDWYRIGSLVGSPGLDNVPIHSSITWMSARYYHLLLLLYYPSPFNASGSTIAAIELLRFAQKHIQSMSALSQHRQLPLNKITLYRALPVSYVLMHTMLRCEVDGTGTDVNDEAAVLLRILESFPHTWSHAYEAANIIRQFFQQISSQAHDPVAAKRAALYLEDIANLIRRSMGKASIYGATCNTGGSYNVGPFGGSDDYSAAFASVPGPLALDFW